MVDGKLAEKIKKFAEKHDEEKLIKLAKDKDAEVRALVVKSLRHVRSNDTFNCVIEALKDQNAEVRLAACGVLGEMGIPKSNDALRYALGKETVPEVTEAIKKALLDIKSF